MSSLPTKLRFLCLLYSREQKLPAGFYPIKKCYLSCLSPEFFLGKGRLVKSYVIKREGSVKRYKK